MLYRALLSIDAKNKEEWERGGGSNYLILRARIIYSYNEFVETIELGDRRASDGCYVCVYLCMCKKKGG